MCMRTSNTLDLKLLDYRRNNNNDEPEEVEGPEEEATEEQQVEPKVIKKPKGKKNTTILHCFCCKVVWKPKFTDFRRHLNREPTPELDEEVEAVIQGMFKSKQDNKQDPDFSQPLRMPGAKKKDDDDDDDNDQANLRKTEKMLEHMNRVLMARERAVMNV